VAKVVDIEVRKRNAALRAAWLDQCLLDRMLSDGGYRMAACIGWRFDKDIGIAIVGRDTLAEVSGVTTRTVDARVDELEKLGHVSVKRYCVRGRANEFTLILKRANEPAPLSESERAKELSPLREKSDARKGETSCELGRRNFRPLPVPSLDISRGGQLSTRAREEAKRAPKIERNGNAPAFTFKDRGRFQRDLADMLGKDGWRIVFALPEGRVNTLCRRLRNKALTAADLVAARSEAIAAELSGGQADGRVG
jgi:hypothetical protein